MARSSRFETLRRLAASQAEPDRSWRQVLRDAVVYTGVGVAAVVALRLLPDVDWVLTQRDRTMDWMVRIHAGISPEGYRGAPLVFVDLDEALYRRWGEPARVPPRAIGALVETAVRADAAIVLVDLDLSGSLGSGEGELLARLEPLARGPVPVVFARSFRQALPAHPEGWLEVRDSALDETIARGPALHWASTRFHRDRDWVIRRTRSFEPTCTRGVARVDPAIHVLTAAWLLEGKAGVERLRGALASHRPDCAANRAARAEPSSLVLAGVPIPTADDRLASRILYGGAPKATPGGSARVDFRGMDVPLFTRVPAALLLEPERPLDPALLSGRVAVIGASFADSGDIHRTPLGPLPGAVILMNATYSLLQFGALRTPHPALVFGAQIALLVLLSLVVARFPLYWSLWLGPLLIAVFLLPLSLWLFRRGLWLDFAIPLILVQVLTLMKKHQDRISDLRRQLRRLRSERRRPASEPASDGAAEGDSGRERAAEDGAEVAAGEAASNDEPKAPNPERKEGASA